MLRGPVLDWGVQWAGLPPTVLRLPARKIRAQRDSSPTVVTSIDRDLARTAAQTVLQAQGNWTIHVDTLGLAHFQLGFRYTHGWHAGRLVASHHHHARAQAAHLWLEFSPLLEALRESLASATGRRVVLHRVHRPPGILVWLPHAAWRTATVVHQDQYYRDLSDELPAAMSDAHCEWREQRTVALTLRVPAGCATGLDTWAFAHEREACDRQGDHVLDDCITSQRTEYSEGSVVMYPSKRFHASGHGAQAWRPLDTAAAARIVLVAFAVPCHEQEGGGKTLHILPMVPNCGKGPSCAIMNV